MKYQKVVLKRTTRDRVEKNWKQRNRLQDIFLYFFSMTFPFRAQQLEFFFFDSRWIKMQFADGMFYSRCLSVRVARFQLMKRRMNCKCCSCSYFSGNILTFIWQANIYNDERPVVIRTETNLRKSFIDLGGLEFSVNNKHSLMNSERNQTPEIRPKHLETWVAVLFGRISNP